LNPLPITTWVWLLVVMVIASMALRSAMRWAERER